MLRVKTGCHPQSTEIHNRWKRIGVNAKHSLEQMGWSAFRLTHWNQKTLLPCIQQWTCWQSSHLLQIPSPASIAPAWRWLEGLYEISLRAHFTTNLYSFSSADLYIQLSRHENPAWHESVFCPFEKGVNLSFFHEETSILQWPACLIWCSGWSNKLN